MKVTKPKNNLEPLPRINGKYVWNEIRSVLNFEKGLFYTIKELLIRPGKTVRDFIHIDRNRLVKPIIFLIVCSFIYTITQQIFKFEDGYISFSYEGETLPKLILDWITRNYGYTNILMGIFFAFWVKVFFRKYHYNFYEILILLCFLMGIEMLIFSLLGIADSLIDSRILNNGSLIVMIYIIWATVQFFDNKRYMNYAKAILSYFLGMLTFFLVISIIIAIIELLL